MPQHNQIYGKLRRILLCPGSNEIDIVLDKDKPMSVEAIKKLEQAYGNSDVIITITRLVRKQKGKED